MKMFRRALAAAILVSTSSVAASASAQTTFQNIDFTDASSGGFTIANQGVGQSFTAVAPTIGSIGVRLVVLNSFAPYTPITYNLYAGNGFRGPLVTSRTVSFRETTGLFDIDFFGTTLNVGSSYTLGLVTSSPLQAIGISRNAYSGGTAYANGVARPDLDFAFRVLDAVPEPGTWAMMVLGVGFVGGALRRRHKSMTRVSHAA